MNRKKVNRAVRYDTAPEYRTDMTTCTISLSPRNLCISNHVCHMP